MLLLLRHQVPLRTQCHASVLAVAVLCNRPRIVRMLRRNGATDEVGDEGGRLWVCMWLRNHGYASHSTCPKKASDLARLLGHIDCLTELRRDQNSQVKSATRSGDLQSGEWAHNELEIVLKGIFQQEGKRNEININTTILYKLIPTSQA